MMIALVCGWGLYTLYLVWRFMNERDRARSEIRERERDLDRLNEDIQERERDWDRRYDAIDRELLKAKLAARVRVADPDAGYRDSGGQSDTCGRCKRDCVHCGNERAREERKQRRKR